MLMVFAKQELVGHPRDVIAHDDVPRFCTGRLFMRGRHGARRIQVVDKKLFEATDRTIPVFRDRGVIVDVLEEKTLQLSVALGKSIAKTGKPVWGASRVVRGYGSGREYALLRGLDQIGDQLIENELEGGVEFQLLPPGGIGGIDLRVGIGKNRRFLSQGIEIEKLCFPGVIEVRGVVGDFVDPIDELTFERRTELEKILGEMRKFRGGVIVRVLDDAFANLKGEIQAGEIKIGTFKLFDDAQCLEIVIEARAVSAHEFVEFLFAGVAEGWMSDVMDESERLGKFRIEAEGSGNRAGNLRNFQCVREPITKMVGITDGEDLRFGLEATKGARMNDAIAVPRVFAAVGMRWFRIAATVRKFHTHGPRRACGEWFDEQLRRWTGTSLSVCLPRV
jgi:hypothetical protein